MGQLYSTYVFALMITLNILTWIFGFTQNDTSYALAFTTFTIPIIYVEARNIIKLFKEAKQ